MRGSTQGKRALGLDAYSLDIAGSCCGIVCFMLVSWFHLPAWIWFLLAMIPYALALGFRHVRGLAVICALLAIAAGFAAWQDTRLLIRHSYRGPLEVS